MIDKMDSCRVEEEHEERLRRGPWTAEEDMILFRCVSLHGEGRWDTIAKYAGLRRTGKSCRLRWLNYLSPAVKRGNITVEEQLLILELHGKWGNRWSRIAKHLPGRTDNEIKNYWRTRMKKVHAHYIVMNNSFSALPSPATAINTLGIQEQRGGGFHCNEIGRNCEDGGEKWKSPMVSTTHDANITDEDFRRYCAAEAVNSCSSGLAAINSSESELSALTTETATFDVEIDWPHVINNLWRIDGMSADTFW